MCAAAGIYYKPMVRPAGWKRTLIALLAFGVAFGYVEAAVVCYLRVINEPVRPSGELFPLPTIDQLREAGPGQQRVLAVEIGREAATIIMLVSVALAVAGRGSRWAAAFAIAFGAWDIAYYVFLKLLLDWPRSLLEWDVLFLIPVPWTAPVLAPLIVSASMIAAGACHLRREARLGWRNWIGISVGAAMIVLSFTLDYRNIMAGGMPRPFNWWIFGLGVLLGVGSFARAARFTRP